eukprot:TRINITY_DN6811_c0_g2_i1.p1 TRINITY_DN6811_c0_g2~~TRINITY_DN6811_c0_g2_i1.p1  ORF type:complete len:624 (-),score=109.36 TRINITY_DN6811_c0_g2_i1:96-1967(-)
MEDQRIPKALVIGGGLSGTLMSILLSRRGFAVALVDSIHDLSDLSEYRTYAIGLTARALRALEYAKLDIPRNVGLPVEGVCFQYGKNVVRKAYSDGQRMINVERNGFAKFLLESAKKCASDSQRNENGGKTSGGEGENGEVHGVEEKANVQQNVADGNSDEIVPGNDAEEMGDSTTGTAARSSSKQLKEEGDTNVKGRSPANESGTGNAEKFLSEGAQKLADISSNKQCSRTPGSVDVLLGWTLVSLEDEGRTARFVRSEVREEIQKEVQEGEMHVREVLPGETMDLDGFDLLIGADGVNSKVREELVRFDMERKVPARERFTFTQVQQQKSWKRLPILSDERLKSSSMGPYPADIHVLFSLRTGVSVILGPRPKGGMLGVIISPEDRTFRFDTRFRFAEEVETFFQSEFPELGQMYLADDPKFMEAMAKDPVLKGGKSTRCSRLHQQAGKGEGGKGQAVVLIGDAAHSVYPTLGLGANSGLEDCRVLDEILAEDEGIISPFPQDRAVAISHALLRYEKARKADVDAAVDLSQNPPIAMLGDGVMSRMKAAVRGRTLSLVGSVFTSLKPQPLSLQADISFSGAKRQVERENWIAFGILTLTVATLSIGAIQAARMLTLKRSAS